MNWLDKLDRKFGRFAIKNLMSYIVGLNAIVFVLNLIDPTGLFLSKLTLTPQYVMQGEVWRLITYIFIPPTFSPLWLVFVLYFYYLIGSSLEHEWGSFKFNIYYFIGMLGTTIAVFLTGGVATAFYLNLSLFLAFAYTYPNFELLLFFFLPVKVKYLAWLDGAYLGYTILTGNMTARVAVLVSILNFIIFFGRDIVGRLRGGTKSYYNRREFHSKIPRNITMHTCEICHRTEKDDKNLEFRYCVECEGDHEYCMDHLYNHEHIKRDKK